MYNIFSSSLPPVFLPLLFSSHQHLLLLLKEAPPTSVGFCLWWLCLIGVVYMNMGRDNGYNG